MVGGIPYPTLTGVVSGADASVYWSWNNSYDAGLIVRRYNVIFRILALSNIPNLPSQVLGYWAGWQLVKVETLAH